MTVAVLFAVASAEIGLCVLWGRGTRIALCASMATPLVFWFLAEGLGGLLTGQATDIGTGPSMILISALLLPLATGRSGILARAGQAPARQLWRQAGTQSVSISRASPGDNG